MQEVGGPLKWHVPVWEGFLLGGSNAKKWGGSRKKNFFISNYVGLSMCDGPIETVKYIWVNTWCILDWILPQDCRNTLPLHRTDQLREECKNLDAIVPDQLLAALAHQVEEFKNSNLVVILHCFSSYQHNNYVAFSLLYIILRENHKMNAFCFPSFHNGCYPACKVWRMLRMVEYLVVTKGHTYLEKPAAFRCRFALVHTTFSYHQALKGWGCVFCHYYFFIFRTTQMSDF